MNTLKGGLTPLPKDERDFQLGALVKYPLLTELPESFSLGAPLTIKDQNADGNEDACTGYGTAGMNEYQENIPLSGAFSFAVGKADDLNKSSWGNDLRSAFRGVQKRGIAEETALSEEDKKLSPQARRDLENWSKPARTNALIHSKKAYVQTKGPYNAFNNIRCALWMYRDEKRAVGFGVKWGWNLSDYILSGTPDGFGHFMYAIGWQGDYLIVVNSAGRNAGRDGIHLVHKDTIEAYIPTFGAYQFIDLTPEEVKARLEGEVTGLSALIDALLIFLGLKKNEVKPMEPVKEEHISKIPTWAKAIEQFETGGDPNSVGLRNNNPGNIKGLDGKFMKFKTYDEGFAYLCDYLTRACTGKHKAYRPDMTLRDFFSVYAPDGDKIINNYSSFVANRLGVFPSVKIKDLL